MMGFLGGGMLPLSFFPEWSIPIVQGLPFTYMISFPVRTLMGEVQSAEYIQSIGMGLLWAAVLTVAMKWVWKRGTLQYSGIGI